MRANPCVLEPVGQGEREKEGEREGGREKERERERERNSSLPNL